MRPAAARRAARPPPAPGCRPLLAVPSLTGPAAVARGPPAPHPPSPPPCGRPPQAAIVYLGHARSARGRLDLLDPGRSRGHPAIGFPDALSAAGEDGASWCPDGLDGGHRDAASCGTAAAEHRRKLAPAAHKTRR